MKTTKLIALSVGVAFAVLSAHAQTFQDVNFESATPSTPVSGPLGPGVIYQPVGLALPGWTAYLGDVQQTEVIQNSYGSGTAEVDLLGPNYPAAGPGPGTIDGNYSVLLQSGLDSTTGNLVSASIAQYGMVPLGDPSLQFKAWTTSFTVFSVSFEGNSLSPVVLGSGANYTLYGVNISSYDGEPGTLEFSALFHSPGLSQIGLDDITFSPTVVSPEPSIVALTAIGGLLFGARKRFARR